jgi:hypothetical protein
MYADSNLAICISRCCFSKRWWQLDQTKCMNTKMWYSFLNWVIDHAILISASASLVLTVLACVFKMGERFIRYLIFGTVILTAIFSLEFYLLQFSYWPFTIIPVIGILGTFKILTSKNSSLKKRYSLILFAASSLLLLFASELSKSNMNTWGSGSIFAGVFMIVHILPLFQLLGLTYKRDSIYGKIKIAIGIISLVIILIFGFKISDYNGETVALIRNSVLYLGGIMILEGLILLSQEKLKVKIN